MQNIIEGLREQSLQKVFSTSTIQKTWPVWGEALSNKIGSPPDGKKALDLGDNLSEIFKLTSASGRSQSSLSGGGAAWEGLVCWYLNLCLVGSRIVVVKQNKTLVPTPISEAITVNYGSFPSNTESDLVAIIFPDLDEFVKDGTSYKKKELDRWVGNNFSKFGVGIIQCKTNWNDNAQIPMLWDMVYSAKGFKTRNISVGSSSYSIEDLKEFTYSFVTVPTSKGPFNENSTAVHRVRNLSGGNYWGYPNKSSVANSIKEIFRKNFRSGFYKPQLDILKEEFRFLDTKYPYFNL